jgi:hypothetical protein
MGKPPIAISERVFFKTMEIVCFVRRQRNWVDKA